ncbi:MAG: hypothetical protein R3Y53_01875 [Bacillota bacterium]
MNMKKYMKSDGTIDRISIVCDVRFGKLKGSDLQLVLQNKEVQKSFIGRDFEGDLNKAHWDKEYLGLLCCMAVAENFNEPYLLHLEAVSLYVMATKKAGGRVKKAISVVLGTVASLFFVSGLVVLSGGKE